MVRRFRYLTRYPDQYPKDLPDYQSPVPSQHSRVPPAFDPSHNPDMQSRQIPQGEPDVSIVRATFDSRPPFAYDFFFEDKWLKGVNKLGGYSVPPAYVIFLRRVVISIYPAATNDLINAQVMTAFGDMDEVNGPNNPPLQILVNGAPSVAWTVGQVILFDAFNSDIDIPVFIPMLEGQQFTINIPGVTSGLGSDLYNTYVHYYGNVLLSTGRNIVMEVGNKNPLPVVDVQNYTP